MSQEKQKIYKQKFRKKWLQDELFSGWLASVKEDEYSAYCKPCQRFLKAKFSDLITHRKTKKHIKCLANYTPQSNSSADYVMIEYSPDMNEDNSASIRLSDSEIFYDNARTDGNHDSSKSHSPNNKSMTKAKTKRKFQFKSESVSKKCNPHDDPELSAFYPKLRYMLPSQDQYEDEITAFMISVMAQMKKLPEEKTVRLTGEIQSLVMRARIEHMEEKKAKEMASQNTEEHGESAVLQNKLALMDNNRRSAMITLKFPR